MTGGWIPPKGSGGWRTERNVERAALVITGVFILVAIAALTLKARAHGWYDHECCHEQDCHEIPWDQTPKIRSDGFVMHNGEFIAKDAKAVRESKDLRWHRCEGFYTHNGEEVRFTRCLYVPQGGA